MCGLKISFTVGLYCGTKCICIRFEYGERHYYFKIAVCSDNNTDFRHGLDSVQHGGKQCCSSCSVRDNMEERPPD